MLEVSTVKSAATDEDIVCAKFSSSFTQMAPQAIMGEICHMIAERYVQEHYQEIAAKLDQNAIANLAIAEASKKIAEEIRLKTEIIERIKPEIWQRGILGGMRKIR